MYLDFLQFIINRKKTLSYIHKIMHFFYIRCTVFLYASELKSSICQLQQL